MLRVNAAFNPPPSLATNVNSAPSARM